MFGSIDPEQTHADSVDFEGIAVDNTRLPSDIIGAGGTRQRHGDAVVKAPSAKRTLLLSYGAPTVREDATRASTMTVAVSVAPPTKSCAEATIRGKE